MGAMSLFGGGGGPGGALQEISKLALKGPPKKKQRVQSLRRFNRLLKKLDQPLPSLPKPPPPAPPATEYMDQSISPLMERTRRGKRYGLRRAKVAGETGGYQGPGAKTTLG